MPFTSWGSAQGQQLAMDDGTCSADIRGDTWGSNENFFGGGPPGCTDDIHPLQRAAGGQVLAMTATSVTLKVHRAINRPTQTYYYYTIWDSSNPTMAGYFGVPAAGKIATLSGSTTYVGLDTMKVFANGIICPGCNPYKAQDPIIGNDYSPLHMITNLLWNCNDALRTGSLFTPANYAQTACTALSPASCDPYPLSVPLKFVECTDYVISKTNAEGFVYFNDEKSLIEKGFVFETYSPVGTPPDADWAMFEIMNTPVVFIADFGDSNLPWMWKEGDRQLVIVGTDNSQRWLYTWMNTYVVDWSGEWDWAEVTPFSRGDLINGTVDVLKVKVGDVVSFWASSMVVPHGLVLSDRNNEYDAAEDAFNAFFHVLETGDFEWEETIEQRFVDVFEHPGWSADPGYGGHFFTGLVQDNSAGTQIYFTDLLWGPYAMNGVLEVEGDNDF